MRPTVTAIIPTFNEAHHIAEAIASVAWCDEVIVVDSFSTDATPELAQSHKTKLFQHEYLSPAEQKNWAIPHAQSEWILFLDADERITEALRKEMEAVLSEPEHEAYWIYRKNHFMGQEVKYSGWQSDKVIRLFKKGSCTYAPVAVHEEMVCRSSVGMLKERMLHYTYKDFGHYMEKFDRYTTWSAKDRDGRTPKVTLYHLWVKPSFRFFRHYILKLGILDGKVGFIISYLSAYSVFLRYLKLDRIRKGEDL
jgi:glycosyltransferase involved in cell wall biosynthesis